MYLRNMSYFSVRNVRALHGYSRMEQWEARMVHTHEVASSSLAPATII